MAATSSSIWTARLTGCTAHNRGRDTVRQVRVLLGGYAREYLNTYVMGFL